MGRPFEYQVFACDSQLERRFQLNSNVENTSRDVVSRTHSAEAALASPLMQLPLFECRGL